MDCNVLLQAKESNKNMCNLVISLNGLHASNTCSTFTILAVIQSFSINAVFFQNQPAAGLNAQGSRNLLALQAYQEGEDIVFRFIIEYSSLRDFGPY
jgi:hypothetical protein